MPFTMWSRGRLLGQSDLGFVQIYSNMRMGWFHPSPQGAKLMSVLTGTGPALRKVGRLLRNPIRQAMRVASDDVGDWPGDIRRTTAYADLASTIDELESMDLELRGADGTKIETEYIGIEDIEFKLSLIAKRDRPRLGVDASESWRIDDPNERYQMQVYFPGPRALLGNS